MLINTKLLRPPLVPELKLQLAEESLPIWQKTEEQLGEINVPPPYWAFAWAGGQALARYILDHRDVVAGKHVVDLGTGSGIVAIAAAKAGAASATATDIDPYALAACRLNSAQNDVTVVPASSGLDASVLAECDVLCLADVFYEKALSDGVMAGSRQRPLVRRACTGWRPVP